MLSLCHLPHIPLHSCYPSTCIVNLSTTPPRLARPLRPCFPKSTVYILRQWHAQVCGRPLMESEWWGRFKTTEAVQVELVLVCQGGSVKVRITCWRSHIAQGAPVEFRFLCATVIVKWNEDLKIDLVFTLSSGLYTKQSKNFARQATYFSPSTQFPAQMPSNHNYIHSTQIRVVPFLTKQYSLRQQLDKIVFLRPLLWRIPVSTDFLQRPLVCEPASEVLLCLDTESVLVFHQGEELHQ